LETKRIRRKISPKVISNTPNRKIISPKVITITPNRILNTPKVTKITFGELEIAVVS
jgi:hypothetical protein